MTNREQPLPPNHEPELLKMKERFYVHEVGVDDSNNLVEFFRDEADQITTTAPFDATVYSEMKHGSPAGIDTAAKELFERIVNDTALLSYFLKDSVVITNSAREVPTASFTIMRKLVMEYLNPYLEANGGFSVLPIRSERAGSIAADDYGTLDKDEREARMNERKTFFSEENISTMRGKKVIIFDDLVATGSYEQNQQKLLESVGIPPEDMIKLYWLQIEPESAKNPTLEARINYAAVHELNDLLKFYYDPELVINERSLKYILPIVNEDGLDDPVKVAALEEFLYKLGNGYDLKSMKTGRENLLKIYAAATSKDGFNNMSRLHPGFMILEKFLRDNSLLPT